VQLSSDQQRQLSQLLEKELDATQRMLEILKQEHQALIEKDADKITHSSEEKLAQLKALEALFSQRDHYLSSLGVDTKKSGLASLLQPLPADRPLARQWQQLLQLAEALQRQNDINGSIVNLSQRHISMALDILTGQASGTPTYGPSGKASSNKSSGRVAKA
jgi:flagellar biosynthesis/type III secretory pathway chaperone